MGKFNSFKMQYTYGSVLDMCKRLINETPSLTMKEAKIIVTSNPQRRLSSNHHRVHSHTQERERNLRHLRNHTHGL